MANVQQDFRPENIPVAVSGDLCSVGNSSVTATEGSYSERPGRFRPDGETPVLDEDHFDGAQCRVFKVTFSDGESWAIRMPIHMTGLAQQNVIAIMQGEVTMLQQLERSGFRWSPRIQGVSLTFDNETGYPFMALRWIPGSCLSWSPDHPGRDIRDKVLRQLAAIQLELVGCTIEDKGSASEFFERMIDGKLGRVRSGSLPELAEQDVHDQKALLPKVLYPWLENAPFAIDHGDLRANNIIVDADHNITGIIDWAFAVKFPFQVAGGLPRLLQLEPPTLPPDEVMQQDRKTFYDSLKRCCSMADAVAWMMAIQSAEDVDFRTCYHETIRSKGTHKWLAEQGWKLPHRQQEGL
ncbi:kinase-like domain-containing protein [Diplogelasinospora grovesii]|uniref:Kinase-like domain-containing protein n=1 Tax=Diplogelasinospora grovesii TaxID=303347 RepID=A0AAN6S2Z2_9PEZI|nr:kinase-like domain-containing protein [Diplogelasinospora grovesii]